ncbi:MAG: hypothetical protein ABSE85_08500 [Candidatus Korobacteraceae bacterium]
MLSGCVVGPKYHPPATQAPAAVYKESPTQFKETEGWTVAQPADAQLRGKWWEIFNDPELNALEEQLNINNQNIKQYFENFMEARAIVREARSQYFPTISVVPSVTHAGASANSSGTNKRHDLDFDLNLPIASERLALHPAGGSVVGAGPLGQGPQYRSRIAIRRPSQRS